MTISYLIPGSACLNWGSEVDVEEPEPVGVVPVRIDCKTISASHGHTDVARDFPIDRDSGQVIGEKHPRTGKCDHTSMPRLLSDCIGNWICLGPGGWGPIANSIRLPATPPPEIYRIS